MDEKEQEATGLVFTYTLLCWWYCSTDAVGGE